MFVDFIFATVAVAVSFVCFVCLSSTWISERLLAISDPYLTNFARFFRSSSLSSLAHAHTDILLSLCTCCRSRLRWHQHQHAWVTWLLSSDVVVLFYYFSTVASAFLYAVVFVLNFVVTDIFEWNELIIIVKRKKTHTHEREREKYHLSQVEIFEEESKRKRARKVSVRVYAPLQTVRFEIA